MQSVFGVQVREAFKVYGQLFGPIRSTHPRQRSLQKALPNVGGVHHNQAVGDYLAIKMLARAMQETKTIDTQKLIAYLESGVKFDVLRQREGYFRPWDHQLLFEMYTVQPITGKPTNKWDVMQTSAPVPGPNESLEVLAPTVEQNACTFS